jgi:aconitate hydratase
MKVANDIRWMASGPRTGLAELDLPAIHEVEYDLLDVGDILQLRALHQQIRRDRQVEVRNATKCRTFTASHALSKRQIEVLFAGGLIRWAGARL